MFAFFTLFWNREKEIQDHSLVFDVPLNSIKDGDKKFWIRGTSYKILKFYELEFFWKLSIYFVQHELCLLRIRFDNERDFSISMELSNNI